MIDARKEYGDIIDLEHFVAPDRPQMSRLNRAAQFSPFAALTGYEDLIDEAARLTSEQVELDDSSKEEIGRRLDALLQMEDPTAVTISYFIPDNKKQGGRYETVTGIIQRYDDIGHFIQLQSGEVIYLDDIKSVYADCFEETII